MRSWIQTNTLGDDLKKYAPGDTIDNKSDCDKFTGFLTRYDHHEEAYTVTDLQEKRITWTHGINNWLGYNDLPIDPKAHSGFPLNYITQKVHPPLREWYEIFLNAATLVFTEIGTRYLASRIVISCPMYLGNKENPDKNGPSVLIKHMAMPLGYRSKNIGSFVNSYTVFGQYRFEPLKLRLFNGVVELTSEEYEKVENKIISAITWKKRVPQLTKKHLEILEVFRELSKDGALPKTKLITKMYKGEATNELVKNMGDDLGDIKQRLNLILGVPILIDGIPPTDIGHFLQSRDPIQVLSFYEQSGLTRLFVALQNKSKSPDNLSPNMR